MKLGIFLLIIGILIAGIGFAFYQYYNPPVGVPLEHTLRQLYQLRSLCIGGIIIGCVLCFCGVLRIVKRR